MVEGPGQGLTVYGLQGCWSCDRLMAAARTYGLDPVLVVVSLEDVPSLLEKFPQVECSSCPNGISLPFAATHDRVVGDVYDLAQFALTSAPF